MRNNKVVPYILSLKKSSDFCRKYGLSLLLLFVLIRPSLAQSFSKVNQFKPEIYKAGNQNWDISIDGDGVVYFANNSGLLVENGIKSTLYQLPSKTIIRSVAAVNDRVYTGTFEDVGYWTQTKDGLQYQSLSDLSPELSLDNQEFWKTVEHNKKLYFQSFGMLLVYDGNSLKSLQIPGSILFLLNSDNRLYVQQIGGGIFEIIDDSF